MSDTSPKDAVKAVAWRITFKTKDTPEGFLEVHYHGHNAIADYRQIDPAAISEPLHGLNALSQVRKQAYERIAKICTETAAEYGRMAIGSNTGQYDHMQNAAEQLATEFAELAEE